MPLLLSVMCGAYTKQTNEQKDPTKTLSISFRYIAHFCERVAHYFLWFSFLFIRYLLSIGFIFQIIFNQINVNVLSVLLFNVFYYS